MAPKRKSSKYFVKTKSETTEKIPVASKASNVSKANLKRGKLPSNWNNFTVDKPNLKYPKNLPSVSTTKKKKDKMQSAEYKPNLEVVAMDCEMVGVGSGGLEDMLARVSIVAEDLSVVYDTFVRPTQPVMDYRTPVSGVRPGDVINAPSFQEVQARVAAILHNKILVGHHIENDLKVLYLSHPSPRIRDTSKFPLLNQIVQHRRPALRHLAKSIFDMEIQTGEHDSCVDARVPMMIYLKFQRDFEQYIKLIRSGNMTAAH